MGILSKFFEGADSIAYFLLLSAAARIALAWMGGKRVVGRVSRLILYPVKSFAGIEFNHLECQIPDPHIGQFGDRQFMLVKENKGSKGTLVTARTEPSLLHIKPRFGDRELHLSAKNMEPLVINLNEVEAAKKVSSGSVHDNEVLGLDCGDKVGDWIDRYLQKTGHRLLYASPLVERKSIKNGRAKYAKWCANYDINDKMVYQDTCTYHILSESSVADLNTRLTEDEVAVDNFRPNIAVSDSAAYDEDNWVKIYIGDAEFSPMKLCGRCVLTTIDQNTAKPSKNYEPVKTLRSYRKLVPSFEEAPCLGVSLVLDKKGTIRVGDPIYALIGRPKLAP